MKQATRRFLKMRPNAQTVKSVETRTNSLSKPNNCMDNAFKEAERSGSEVVAGWIVGEYNSRVDSTPIMFHFVNRDANGVYYDTTPIDTNQKFDFIEDSDVWYDSYAWSKANLDSELHLPPSVKMRSNTVSIAIGDVLSGDYRFVDIPEQPVSVKRLLDIRAECREEA